MTTSISTIDPKLVQRRKIATNFTMGILAGAGMFSGRPLVALSTAAAVTVASLIALAYRTRNGNNGGGNNGQWT